MGPRGIQTIEDLFEGWECKGKGKEFDDLDSVMKKLEIWAHRLYPKLPFDNVIDVIADDDSESDFDEDGFSPMFYEKLLSECCGLTPSKKNIDSRHKKFLTMNYDPINIARTYFILKEILDINLDMSMNQPCEFNWKNKRSSAHFNP